MKLTHLISRTKIRHKALFTGDTALLNARFWFALILSSVLIGSACAFFLWSLNGVTDLRDHHPWLLYLLPLGGFLVGMVYHQFGRSVESGNNLVLDEIHQPGGGIPRRMAPLVLFGTLMTHLFGGSAGREGTAVQMGGSMASALGNALKLKGSTFQLLLMAGIAAGFGGVFGTPLAGGLFAVEVLAIGGFRLRELFPCLLAAYMGDWSCQMWHIFHTHYDMTVLQSAVYADPFFIAKVILAAICFGLISKCFAESVHTIQALLTRMIPFSPLRPVLGGVLLIVFTALLGTPDYLGLGVESHTIGGVSIVKAFHHPVDLWAWLWKLLFTVITISCGFKGGEVTPLFFIGATLGNALALVLNAPLSVFAGLGFLAVFASAANTPIACTVMGLELFGWENGLWFGLACLVAYWVSGHSGIYLSQKISVPKRFTRHQPEHLNLRSVRKRQSAKRDN